VYTIIKKSKMAELDKICEGKVKFDGIFNFGEIYKFVYTMLGDYEYKIEEKVYSEKSKPTGKEIEIVWMTKRKISDYFRFRINVTWLILGMSDVEVQKDGAKVKLNKGNLEIKFTTYLEKDYEQRWENNSIVKFMRGIYDKYIIKSRIETYEDKVKEETDEFIAQAKAFLALEAKI